MKDREKLAFPLSEGYRADVDEGMTLRDYFAAKAIINHPYNLHEVDNIEIYAYELADAMSKAREESL